jgi:hypothetical protein
MAVRYNTSLPAQNLQLLLDASNPKSYPGSGTTWFDVSGNRRNFVWNGTGGAVHTSAGMRSYFSTNGTRAQGPASNSFGINNGTGYTIFAVSTTLTDNAQSMFKFYNTTVSVSSLSRAIFVHPGWSNLTMYFDQGTCCDADERTQQTFTEADMRNFRVWCFRSRLYDRSIFMNGVQTVQNVTYAANIDMGSAVVDLGGSDEYGGAASTWNGQLALFAVYNTGLDDNTVLEVSKDLMPRFGL